VYICADIFTHFIYFIQNNKKIIFYFVTIYKIHIFAKQVLSAYGITDKNLEEIFSDDKDVNAIILAITIAGTERQALSTRSQIANCALDALGIPAELLVGSAKSLTKKPS